MWGGWLVGRLFAVFGLRQSLRDAVAGSEWCVSRAPLDSPGCAHHLRRGQEVKLTQAGFHLMMSSAEIPGSPGEFASH